MEEKLNVKWKDVNEHDSTLFQSNGLALKQGEEFAHNFNVKQIKCIEVNEGHGRTVKYKGKL